MIDETEYKRKNEIKVLDYNVLNNNINLIQSNVFDFKQILLKIISQFDTLLCYNFILINHIKVRLLQFPLNLFHILLHKMNSY